MERVLNPPDFGTQCDLPYDPAPEEVKGDEERKDGQLDTIEEASDEDVFSIHSEEGAPGKVTVGIQTNEGHVRKVAKTEAFKKRQ